MAYRFVGLFALTLVTRVAIFTHTFFSDEATYSALATKIGTGAFPYVGAVDHKPPGIELVYAGVFEVTGRNHLVAVRLVLVVVVALTALLLGRLARRTGAPRAELPVAVLYILASTWGLPGDVQSANTELFLNLAIVGAASLVLAPRRTVAACVAAGALTALAALFKYQAAVAGAGWALIVALDRELPVRARIAQLAALAAGFGVLAAAYLGVFRLAGAWDDFVFWGWQYSFRYIASIGPGEMVVNACAYTAMIAACWAPVLLSIGRPSPALLRRTLPWLAAMTLAASVGGRFYPHYFLMMLPPVVLLAGEGFAEDGRRRAIARGLAVAISIAAIATSVTRPELGSYLRRGFRAHADVGAWIRAHSDPEARVFVWGNSPEIYYEADRVMGTRFPFCNYHTGKIWGTRFFERDSPGAPGLVVPLAWRELLADLTARPPELLVDGAAGGLKMFDAAPIASYPELARFVAAHYTLAETVDDVPIYRLR